jgi:hypothetical protein
MYATATYFIIQVASPPLETENANANANEKEKKERNTVASYETVSTPGVDSTMYCIERVLIP